MFKIYANSQHKPLSPSHFLWEQRSVPNFEKVGDTLIVLIIGIAGCSEISIHVIVKHVQHVGTIWACNVPQADLLSFSVPGGDGLGLLGWNQYTGTGTVSNVTILISLKFQNFLCQPWLPISNLLKKFIATYPTGAAGPKPMVLWSYKKSLKMRSVLVSIINRLMKGTDLS